MLADTAVGLTLLTRRWHFPRVLSYHLPATIGLRRNNVSTGLSSLLTQSTPTDILQSFGAALRTLEGLRPEEAEAPSDPGGFRVAALLRCVGGPIGYELEWPLGLGAPN